jgi:hypothetical protein
MRRTVCARGFWFLLIGLGLWIVLRQGHALVGPARADPQPAPTAEPKVELKPVKWADLTAVVRAQQGKVLVVEVWAEY